MKWMSGDPAPYLSALSASSSTSLSSASLSTSTSSALATTSAIDSLKAQPQSVDNTWHRFKRTTKAFLVEVEALLLQALSGKQFKLGDLPSQAQALARDFLGFGLGDAGSLAEQLDRALSGLNPRNVGGCARLVGALRIELDRYQYQTSSAAGTQEQSSNATLVLVASRQSTLSDRLALMLGSHGYRVRVAAAPQEFEDPVHPRLILLDAQFERDIHSTLEHVEYFHRLYPECPVTLLSESLDFELRLLAARAKVSTVLEREPGVERVLEAFGRGQAQADAKKGRVLLVEDEVVSRKVLTRVLQGAGYQVTTCDSADSFWRQLEESSPDILMLDYLLPGATGAEICRVVRSDPRYSSIPILFLTASKDPDVLNEIHFAGGDDVLVKPVVGSELVNRIANRLLRAREMRLRGDVDFHVGIPGRRQSMDILALLIKLAHRQENPVSVLLSRIDFSSLSPAAVQDGWTGPAILSETVRLFKEHLRRPGDVVGRWDDETLVVALFDTGRDSAQHLVEGIGTSLFEMLGKSSSVLTYTGLATFPADGGDLAALLVTLQGLLQRSGPNRIATTVSDTANSVTLSSSVNAEPPGL